MPELRVEEWKGVSQATRALLAYLYISLTQNKSDACW